jgi:carbonic anhydrase
LASRARVASAASGGPPTVTPDGALARLMAGNAKFVAGTLEGTRALAERRADVATVQRPFAMVLCCADSRVSPEHVFDQGVGDLFVCRVAGNVLEPAALGSFEYAVANIGSPAVLVVLGHERCGAVSDSIKLLASGTKAPGSIANIVDAIAPAVQATDRGTLSEAAYVEAVVRANARLVAHEALDRSEILRNAVAAHHLKVVAGRYGLASGRVTLL